MKDKQKVVRLYVEGFPAELHRSLKLEAVLRGTSIKALIERAAIQVIAEGQRMRAGVNVQEAQHAH